MDEGQKKMNNKIKVMGEVKRERKIKDMKKGEEAYTLPWAYDADKGELNENSPIVDTFCGNNAGTTSMKVKRIDVADYKYTITVPKDYRNFKKKGGNNGRIEIVKSVVRKWKAWTWISPQISFTASVDIHGATHIVGRKGWRQRQILYARP